MGENERSKTTEANHVKIEKIVCVFVRCHLLVHFFRCVTIVNVHIMLKCLKIVKCSVMLRVSGLRWINTTLEHSTRFTSVFGVFENLP